MGSKRWYITTPIYYPSDKLHIGHAYTTVAADALARFHRLRGDDVWFVTGTDEHGQKIAKSAKAAGTSPQEFVDRIVGYIQDPLWKMLGISYDDFIRTTEPRHREVVQAIFRRLRDQGDIYKGVYEGWYCLPCEAFWAESRLVDGRCPDCGRPVERVRQESYFFRLARYQERMRAYILEHPEFIQPPSRRNEMLSFLDAGLEDLSISRSGFTWGIEVPDDPGHVIYVWFDALANYLTAAGYLTDPARFVETWPANVHLVGKEIVRFHTIIWPIMLMALDLPLPERVFGHGWLLIGDTKMSKSLGNAVEPVRLIERYGVDAIRYFLLREVPFGADGSYTEEALVLRINVDLANDLGNLLSRTTAMISRFADGRIPPYHPETDDGVIRRQIDAVAGEVAVAMETLQISDALTAIQRMVRTANKYIEDTKPWSLARSPEDRALLDNVLYTVAESLRVLSVLLTPFLLETPGVIRRQLGIREPVKSYAEARFGGLAPGGAIDRGEPLFPRIGDEDATVEDAGQKPKDGAPAPAKSDAAWIDLADFQNVDLRVASVRSATTVAGADRLLKLTVFDGERERTIVSGIRQRYPDPAELVGRQVVLVANLRPAKIRGQVSEGMLLAGTADGVLSLVAPVEPLPPGTRIK